MVGVQEDIVGRTILGRYRVLSHLGAGGMGAVYLARAEGAAGFTKPVVIKHIHPELTADASASQMFVREARILSNLQHAGIVNVLDFGEQDGRYAMVLEYIHGYDLAQWARYHREKLRPFPLDHALSVSQSVLGTLHYAHTHMRADGTRLAVVHRDVSPGNVLLDLDGQVKLADFGIARIYDEQGDRNSIPGGFKGKFAYSAPELLDAKSASPQSDVYAWGVVLYQLLSGGNPFRARTVPETLQRVMTLMPPSISAQRADVPKAMDAVLERAMAKRREDRFADAAQFALALQPFITKTAEETRTSLREAVRRDFLSDMPSILGVFALCIRESAWRDADGRSLSELTSIPPSASADAATVLESVSAALVTESKTLVQQPGESLLDGTRHSARPSKSRAGNATGAAVAIGVLALLGAGAAIALSLRKPPANGPQVVIVERRSVGEQFKGSSALPTPSISSIAGLAPSAQAEAKPESSGAPSASSAPTVQSRAGSASEVGSGESGASLTRAVQSQRSRFVACFEQHVQAVEGAPQLNLKLTVAESGKVTSAHLAPSEVGASPLGRCVLAVARSIQFPALQEAVSFSVPITTQASR